MQKEIFPHFNAAAFFAMKDESFCLCESLCDVLFISLGDFLSY